jgi:small subunit ribosomal protein S34|tara:strand:+ start:5388 stop:5714 length:327 start_codon:yes stop_codon:yes gene_type:complete
VFELAKMQPAYGVGSRFARARWEERGAADSFWTVTRMKPRPSGRSGTAWGFLTWKGSKKDGLVKIPSAQTPGIWKVLQSAGDGIQGGPTLEMPSVATDSSGEDTEEKA